MFLINILRASGQLNSLKTGDVIFFVLCGVIILAIVGIYFLIPVIKRKQLEEQRTALREREKAFKAARNKTSDVEVVEEINNEENVESTDGE